MITQQSIFDAFIFLLGGVIGFTIGYLWRVRNDEKA